MFDWQWVYVVVMVIFLEGILSIDNAAVLGAMVSALPPHAPIPWPGPLRFLSGRLERVLGGQRSAALKVGLLGAYLGRGLMLVLASFVIHNPWLKLAGALYLVKLAMENLGKAEPGEEQQVGLERVANKGFWGVVIAVELADLAFSLDNVVAVVALSDQLWLVMFGVAIGIITMRFAAGIFTWLIEREPILKPAAYILVLNIGTELLLSDFLGVEVESVLKFAISAGTLVLAVAYAHVAPLRLLQPVLGWIAEGLGNLNELADWGLKPFVVVVNLLFRGLLSLIHVLGRALHVEHRRQVPEKVGDPAKSPHR